MNRYRTIPSLGQPKASATTTCQKCLKKDKFRFVSRDYCRLTKILRHYSYECKSTTQERPYISRPSRTQQFMNPKLKPKLASDTGNALLRSEGIADAELARAEAARATSGETTGERRSRSPEHDVVPSRRDRSASVSSSDSVSTISTSRSRSPHSKQRMSPDRVPRRQEERSRSRSMSRSRKRKHRDSSFSRSPPRFDSSNKTRRYRSDSPDDRGRPKDNRRGSNRSRSRDASANRSEITRHRRSLEDIHDPDVRRDLNQPNRFERRQPHQPKRKERSLSPYSRRLALTQAMNSGR